MFEYAGNDGDDITIRAVDPDLDFWKRGEPNGETSGENCLQITSEGEWLDYMCEDQVTALCEIRC